MKRSNPQLTKAVRRRKQSSFWQRQWQRLTLEEQAKLRSMAWSASIHLLLIAVLATLGFATPMLQSTELTGEFAGEGRNDELDAMLEPDIAEMIIQEVESLSDMNVEALVPEPGLAPTLAALELPDSPTESEEGAAVSELAGMSNQVHAIGELKSDAARIAETDRRVAAAGGALQGPVRVSLIFSGDDDIDLHVKYEELGRAIPRLNFLNMNSQGYIFYGRPRSDIALLDVDANAHAIMPDPCENIIFESCPRVAHYSVAIHYYAQRGPIEPVPYIVVVKYGSTSKVFKGTILPKDGLKVITNFRYSS